MLPERGEVAIGTVSLNELGSATGAASDDAWWSSVAGGLIGALLGTVFGLLGALIGTLPREVRHALSSPQPCRSAPSSA